MTLVSKRRIAQMLTVACAAVALVAPRVAQAQTGKITGVVTDATTNRPVEGVTVVVQGTGYGTVTPTNGRYFIVNVPPGNYTLIARRIGYQSVEVANLNVSIDVTREQNFRLTPSTTTLTAQRIVAEQAPLIERNQVGSSTTVTAEQIQSLPVTSIAGVLSLQQGFTETPQNTSVMSVAEEQRSTSPAIRVRAGRGGSTLSMVDGIPINNPLFGSEAITPNALSVQQVTLSRGFMDPQYGNALSGVINQALREGGSEVAGSIDYQNSALAGAIFGNEQDKLLGANLLRGFLSGPIPGTSAKVRYAVSGQVESRAGNLLQFDNDIYSVNRPAANEDALPPSSRDLVAGWRAFGGRQNQQIVGKLTFLPTSNFKVSVTGIGQERTNVGYDRGLLPKYNGDPLALVTNRVDSLQILTDATNRLSRDLLQSTVRDRSTMFGATAEQRFGRTTLTVRAAQTDFARETCPLFLGVCRADRYFRPNFSQGFLNPSPTGTGGDRVPDAGTMNPTYGGEEYVSRTVRADLQSQVTDRHNVQFGVQGTQHDITYKDIQGFGQNTGTMSITTQVYRAKPVEFATYIQDKIEYDFLTINIGGRYDYGVAKGRGFTNPFDPTNGTSARTVCEGGTVSGQRLLAANGSPYGVQGCLNGAVNPATQRSVLLDSATRIAQLDDFSEAKARTGFSPRLGVNFPLTENSGVYFNAGRYTQIPLYGNGYRNTGIGTVAGLTETGGDNYCASGQIKPGTTECAPNILSTNPEFVGNPNLLLEKAIQYEVGYDVRIGRNYSFQAVVFNRDESGLAGIRQSRSTQDIGSTYDGALPQYQVLVNGDFLTSRGLELQLRRATFNHWGYNINYGWARATQSGPPPDRANELLKSADENNRYALLETLSEVDQSHNFNVSLNGAFRNDVPTFRGANLLKNTSASLTYQFRTGSPYTPVRGTSAGALYTQQNQGEINSARMPNTQNVNADVRKSFTIANVSYAAFVRVSNLLDRKNCVQVFVNTGTCDNGLRDFTNRRIGNTGDEGTSTAYDMPQYIGARRSFFTGIKVDF